jgi:hypothetical protein
VATGGYYQVTGIAAGSLTLKNLGYTGNAAPAATITAPQQVSPGGLEGPAGSAPSVTLNQLSPSSTKGDVLADTGANNPNAALVRLGVGTDGKALVADSSQPTGLNYATITPNTVTNANDIPRFSGTTGTPMAVKDSKLLITDDGAIQSTPSGGNARGSKAVDLQCDRSAAANVASGAWSTVSGGIDNKASQTWASVAGGAGNAATGVGSSVSGGSGNTSSGSDSAVAGGTANLASASFAFVGGGTTNQATQTNSSVLAGANNLASGQNAAVLGGSANIASGTNAVASGNTSTASGPSSWAGGIQSLANKHGQRSNSSGQFAAAGDAQASELIWRAATTDATPTELFLDGVSATQRAIIPNNTTWGGVMTIVGRSSAGVCAVWEVKFGIQNNANTVTLISAVTTAMIADGTGGSWGVVGNASVAADNVNKALAIAMTGFAATSIRFTAHAHFVEVGY